MALHQGRRKFGPADQCSGNIFNHRTSGSSLHNSISYCLSADQINRGAFLNVNDTEFLSVLQYHLCGLSGCWLVSILCQFLLHHQSTQLYKMTLSITMPFCYREPPFYRLDMEIQKCWSLIHSADLCAVRPAQSSWCSCKL